MQEIDQEADFYARLITKSTTPDVQQPIVDYGRHLSQKGKVEAPQRTAFYRALFSLFLPGYAAFAERFGDNKLAHIQFEDAIAVRVYELNQVQ